MKYLFVFLLLPCSVWGQQDTVIIGETIYKVFPQPYALPHEDTTYLVKNDTVFMAVRLGIDSSLLQVYHYTKVEIMPQFPGGADSMMAFIRDNYRVPDEDKNRGREGRIVVRFTINADGSVTDPVIHQGISTGLDLEAKRVVQLLHFEPGKRNGKAVKTWYTLSMVVNKNERERTH